jgi:hypothetical protein
MVGRYFFVRGGVGVFTGDLEISTGKKRGFSLVVKCIFVVVTWFLEARFSALKIFLVFELYFSGFRMRQLVGLMVPVWSLTNSG